MSKPIRSVVALAALTSAGASRANPIRRVVTLLQKMQERVIAEGEREKKLYDEFMCQCKNQESNLAASAASGADKAPMLNAGIEKAGEEAAQNKEDLAQAQADRIAAKTALAEAAAIRKEEAAAFATTKAEYEANVNAMTKAVGALGGASAASFLQSGVTQKLIGLAQDSKLSVGDRETLVAYLQGEDQDDEFAPSGGEIVGILKQMTEQMQASLQAATQEEQQAVAKYNELVAARTKELNALQKDIEVRLKKNGELAVQQTQMKNDQADAEEAMAADQNAAAGVAEGCKKKTAEYEERTKTRGVELQALADTIKMLNSDEALEMFKKSGLNAASSFLQVQVRASAVRSRAVDALRSVPQGPRRARIDLISLALRGKSTGFDKVLKMVDSMVATLQAEQNADDKKKEDCGVQMDESDDQRKVLARSVQDADKSIGTIKDDIANVNAEIRTMESGLRNFEDNVAKAGKQRQEESATYKELMAQNGAAKELILAAKERLKKAFESAFVQVSASSARATERNSIMDMMDTLVRDLDKQMTEASAEEKNAQAEYDNLTTNSGSKKAADEKALTQKRETAAQMEKSLEDQLEAKDDVVKELDATKQFIHALNLECDFLLKNYDMRKEARAAEMDSLVRAKDILSGADYSFTQFASRSSNIRGHLRH